MCSGGGGSGSKVLLLMGDELCGAGGEPLLLMGDDLYCCCGVLSSIGDNFQVSMW